MHRLLRYMYMENSFDNTWLVHFLKPPSFAHHVASFPLVLCWKYHCDTAFF